MQVSLSQPNHQDSTQHLKEVCVHKYQGRRGKTFTKFKLGILFFQFLRSLHTPSINLTCSRPLRNPWSTRPTTPSPTTTWDCSSPGTSGVESHHILQHIASFCPPFAQYQPPEGIPRSRAASGRPASLPQRGKRSLSGQLAHMQTVRLLPAAYISTTPSTIFFEILPIYVIEINIINR